MKKRDNITELRKFWLKDKDGGSVSAQFNTKNEQSFIDYACSQFDSSYLRKEFPIFSLFEMVDTDVWEDTGMRYSGGRRIV